MIDPTMESLWLAIGADPDEAMNYLAMADRLEELGRTGEAARARWLGDNDKVGRVTAHALGILD